MAAESRALQGGSVEAVGEPVRLRDELELSVLEEFGEPVLAEAVGAAFRYAYETLYAVMGIDPKPFDDLDDYLDQIGD